MGKYCIIHPFLFAILPILILFIDNIDVISYKYLPAPILFVIFVVIILLTLTSFFIKDIHLCALLISPMILFALSSGMIYGYIYALFPKTRYLIPAVGLVELSAYGLFCIKLLKWTSPTGARKLTKLFNIIAAIMVFINVSQIVFDYTFSQNKNISSHPQDNYFKYKFPGPPPDIYYIIVDEYASLNQIKTYYRYDNTAFAERLKKMGFFIATKSEVRNPNTGPSLAASLNMQDTPEQKTGSTFSSVFESISEHFYMSENPKDFHIKKLIQKNEVARFLTAHNYKYFHIGSSYYPTQYNKYADYNINYFGFNINNPLVIALCDASIIRFLFGNTMASISLTFQRDSILSSFVALSKVARIAGPKFVFAHVICPHGPFIFGPNGEVVPFYKTDTWSDKSLYLGQYIFITKKVEQTIKNILDESPNTPIIILQSDHGVRYNKPLARMIFNAYLLPHNGNKLLYDTISPFNTFRLLFDYYFNTNYGLLPDIAPSQK